MPSAFFSPLDAFFLMSKRSGDPDSIGAIFKRLTAEPQRTQRGEEGVRGWELGHSKPQAFFSPLDTTMP